MAEASLDWYISMMEQFGALCPDCEVGEPHICPLRFKQYMAQQRRGLQTLTDLAALEGRDG